MKTSQLYEIAYKRFCEIAVPLGLRPSGNEMARYLDVSIGQAQAWKTGQRPSADALEAMVRKLGLSPRWLLTGEGEPLEDAGCAPREEHPRHVRRYGRTPLDNTVRRRLARHIPGHAVGTVATNAFPGQDRDSGRSLVRAIMDGRMAPTVGEFYALCVAVDLKPEEELEAAARETVITGSSYPVEERRDPFEVEEVPTDVVQVCPILHEPDHDAPPPARRRR